MLCFLLLCLQQASSLLSLFPFLPQFLNWASPQVQWGEAMTTSGGLGHGDKVQGHLGACAGSVPDLLGNFSRVCSSPSPCISLQSTAETISSAPDGRTGVLQIERNSWMSEENLSYQFESHGIVRQDYHTTASSSATGKGAQESCSRLPYSCITENILCTTLLIKTLLVDT